MDGKRFHGAGLAVAMTLASACQLQSLSRVSTLPLGLPPDAADDLGTSPGNLAAKPGSLVASPLPGASASLDTSLRPLEQLPLTDAVRIISTSGGVLTGVVRAPEISLVGNHSTGLIFAGGGSFYRARYRVLTLTEQPVVGAKVTIVGPDGNLLLTPETKTDESGRYRVAVQETATGTVLIRAEFGSGETAFRYETIATVAGSGTATADIDTSSTLVNKKITTLAARGEKDILNLDRGRHNDLVMAVRRALTPENVPYLGAKSADVLPAFDQLVQDDPSVGKFAAAGDARLLGADHPWQVAKAFDSDDFIRMGIYQPMQRQFLKAGTFEADLAGNLYLPSLGATGSPIVIHRVTPAGKSEVYASLPAGLDNPVFLALSPAGKPFVMAHDQASRQLRVYEGAGIMQRRPGYASNIESWNADREPQGRLVVDKDETLYFSLINAHIVGQWKKGTLIGRQLAGKLITPGYADGPLDDARFNFPFGLVVGPDNALFVADTFNRAIRRIGPDGQVTTYAGRPGESSYRNGRGAHARFGTPTTLAFDTRGDLFVTDPVTRRVRRVSAAGSVFLVAGSGQAAVVDGVGDRAAFNKPKFLTSGGVDTLWIADTLPNDSGDEGPGITQVIRKISRAQF